MKKLFLLLTAMLLSAGMWATESETFPTSRSYNCVKWGNGELDVQKNELESDYTIQSKEYAKVDLKTAKSYCSFVVCNITDPKPDQTLDPYNYFLYLQASEVEVTLLDNHAEIESITIEYITNITITPLLSIDVNTSKSTMPFPEGETSHLFTFTPGPLKINSITVNYHLTAVDNVPYIDEAGNAQTQDNVNVIYSSSEQTTLDAGWYVVNGTDVQTGTLICNGAVHLILADGAKLTARGNSGEAGIQVSGAGNSLFIYGQTEQTGQLIATGGTAGAGIGGGSHSSGSNITINGGVITANGGSNGAGIGGGSQGDGTNITINSGVVTTTGGTGGAGIGGGPGGDGTNITINGGIVTAIGGEYGAGIGEGSSGGHTAYITFNGGKVWISGNRAFGIDGPQISNIYVDGSLLLKGGSTNPPTNIIGHRTGDDVTNDDVRGFSYVTIEPVEPMTVSFDKQGGEGGSDDVIVTYQAPMPQITIPARGEDVFLGYFSEVNGQGTKYYNADGTSAHDWDQIEAITLYAKWKVAVSYIDEDGTQKTKDAHSYTEITGSVAQVTWTAGWYLVYGNITLSRGAICNGDVHLILADGAKLTATGDVFQAGIRVTGSGNSLTIYGQTAQSGQLIANGGRIAAGIGGDRNNPTGEHITICGGKIIATGGENGAGIGGGLLGSGTDITIRNGEVIANGGDCAAAIGSGDAYRNSESFNVAGATNITILGGKVVATGGDLGAGIGGGWRGYASDIIISGGDVTAIGGRNAAGIGAGNDNQGHHIYINGGTITATSGENASAIGNGNNASYGFAHHDIYVNTSVVVKAGDSPDPNDVIDNLTSTEIAGKIKRKRYVTIEPGAIIVTHYAENMDANYGTYYNGTQAYEVVSEGVTMYTASLETYGTETWLNLSEIDGNILPAGTPVIVKQEYESTATDYVELKPYAESTAGITVPANSLSGTDVDLTVADNTVYTMAAEDNALGFYLFNGTTIPAHKAYLQLEPGQSAPRRISFGSHTTTGVESAECKVQSAKYIRDGQLYIEREGRIYNAQGAIVK